MIALRENEALATSVGIDVTRYLVLTTVVSAAMAGAAGALYAHYVRIVDPDIFLFVYTVTMVIMVVTGGKGTLAGPVVGGLIFGLTAALYGEVTIDKGRVQQSNFNNYRMLRIDEVPRIDVHIIKSGEAPGGIGETGTTAGPPALRNAIYAAAGVALRRLPIDRDLLAVRKRS